MLNFLKDRLNGSCVLNDQFTVVIKVAIYQVCTVGQMYGTCFFAGSQGRPVSLIMRPSFVSPRFRRFTFRMCHLVLLIFIVIYIFQCIPTGICLLLFLMISGQSFQLRDNCFVASNVVALLAAPDIVWY